MRLETAVEHLDSSFPGVGRYGSQGKRRVSDGGGQANAPQPGSQTFRLPYAEFRRFKRL